MAEENILLLGNTKKRQKRGRKKAEKEEEEGKEGKETKEKGIEKEKGEREKRKREKQRKKTREKQRKGKGRNKEKRLRKEENTKYKNPVENNKTSLYPKNSEKPFIFLYISNSGCTIRNLYTGMINNIP